LLLYIAKQKRCGNVNWFFRFRSDKFSSFAINFEQKLIMEPKVNEILSSVFDLFKTYGIKNFSMDDISRELRMSKKTLYKYFDNKSDLIKKLFEYEHSRFDSKIQEEAFNKTEGNAIDVLLTVSKIVAETYMEASPHIIFEMKKYFYEENEIYWNMRLQYIIDKVILNFKRGMDEGIYRKNLRIELEAKLYVHRLRMIHLDEKMSRDLEDFDSDTIFSCFFESLIRSISNRKGIEYFESKKTEMGLVSE